MLKRLIPVIFALAASSASAQILNPGVIVLDEASQLGRARSLAFVGSSVSCGISGGLATCTFTAPSVTLTHNSTATSGCTAGALFRSTSSLADCSAGLTYASDRLDFGTSSAFASITNKGRIYYNSTTGLTIQGSSATEDVNIITSTGNQLFRMSTSAVSIGNGATTTIGATTIGSSSLGSTVVPLTVRLGTGGTAQIQRWENSGGTALRYILAGGSPVSVTAAPTVSNTSADSCGTTAATLAGTADTGIITVGATSGTSCTLTFPVTAPTRRQCVVTNETTANLVRATASSTTVTVVAGTFVAGDVLAYICSMY